jgi:glutamyl-tRNA(Gln) amidotransferase subunit E
MAEINYEKLKFKSGLEIHQQLDSSKLFCNCPSILRGDEPDFEIKRKLQLVAGEFGEVDIAAKHESGKNKEFIYQSYKNSTCLVELDEEPPHFINQEALKIGIQIAILMNMKIIPITQIMRKTVIDGSNTSGFQRTVMVARDGFIETSFGKVRIDFLYLEEDSARIIKKENNCDIYRLDRLGIPLVEIVTAPDFKTPEHAKETALKIGEILRSCKVRRGIGTIRQDVNISIREENRVEMKGMQDMDIFISAINNEILRQKELSDMKEPTLMEVRNVLDDGNSEFMRPLPGKSRMYPETDLPLLKISREFIDDIKKNLPKLKSENREDLKKHGLNEEMIKLILNEDKIEEFKNLLRILNQPQLVAKSMLIYQNEIAKKFGKTEEDIKRISEIINNSLEYILMAVKQNQISENDIKEVMERIAKGISMTEAIKIEKADLSFMEERVLDLINSKPGLSENAYMGLVMKEFKGKISGNEAMEIIKKVMRK